VLLPFVARSAELARLRRALTATASTLVCVYGRRRVGKSRLVARALDGLPAVYYLADERDERLQRQSVGTVRRAGWGPKAVVGATSKRRRPGSAAIARGRASSLATAGMKWC